MDSLNKWFEFMNTAQTLLFQGQKIDNYKPIIQIAIEPSFDKSIFLQLVIIDNEVYWYRTTWERLIDAPKFSNPIESLKYIGQNIKPTILYENGVIEKENINHIVDFIKTISIRPKIDKWGGIVLDGINYSLTVGVENTQTTYKWNYLPEEWTELDELRKLLEKLNAEIK
jgi:hypothetical protein